QIWLKHAKLLVLQLFDPPHCRYNTQSVPRTWRAHTSPAHLCRAQTHWLHFPKTELPAPFQSRMPLPLQKLFFRHTLQTSYHSAAFVYQFHSAIFQSSAKISHTVGVNIVYPSPCTLINK